LWDIVGRTQDDLTSESGAAALRRQFDTVERREITGTARFPTVSSILGLLDNYGEFSWFADVDLEARLDGVSTPFDATYRHSIFVAR
jgi:hypothetical protein